MVLKAPENHELRELYRSFSQTDQQPFEVPESVWFLWPWTRPRLKPQLRPSKQPNPGPFQSEAHKGCNVVTKSLERDEQVAETCSPRPGFQLQTWKTCENRSSLVFGAPALTLKLYLWKSLRLHCPIRRNQENLHMLNSNISQRSKTGQTLHIKA